MPKYVVDLSIDGCFENQNDHDNACDELLNNLLINSMAITHTQKYLNFNENTFVELFQYLIKKYDNIHTNTYILNEEQLNFLSQTFKNILNEE